MLKLNDMVMYGTTGVCVVENIESKKIGREVKQYYVLKPICQSTATVYVPADNEKLISKAKAVITVNEIDSILKSVAEVPDIWVESDSERRVAFSEIVSSGDRKRQLVLLRSLWKRRTQLATQSKRLHLADERVLKEVQRLIYDEFSIVLSLNGHHEVEIYIKKRLEK